MAYDKEPDPGEEAALNVPAWVAAARLGWTNTGLTRPPFAQVPEPGQESVWDYPRPPVVVADQRLVVVGGDDPLVTTRSSLRLLETASPPTFYLPMADTEMDRLIVLPRMTSVCEWKGRARYWATTDDPRVPIAWDYPEPFDGFDRLVDHLAFYPSRIACLVDSESVRAQAGSFYGGWITSEIVGPFKGESGTQGW